jgi:RNA polymerase sigma factor (TIGR02999 family)
MTHVTQILKRLDRGDAQASEELLPLVYEQLRQLASRELARESSGMTLQPTALVHEAYLRLVDQKQEPQWSHRGHFYSAAARAMRRILVENARRKRATRHGGNYRRLPIDQVDQAAPQRHPDILALDEALSQLEAQRPELAELVTLRYFAGLTVSEAANRLGVSTRTAERDWAYAKAWLLQFLSEDDAANDSG